MLNRILNDEWVVNLRNFKQHATVRFRRSKNLLDALEALPGGVEPPRKPYLKSEFGCSEPVRFMVSEDVYNSIKDREKEMFNKEDLEFIKESTEKNLAEIKENVNYVTERLGVYAKSLGEIKDVESKLNRILESIIESEKKIDKVNEDSNYMKNYFNSRCC